MTNKTPKPMESFDPNKPLFQCTLVELHAMLADLKMNQLLEPVPEKTGKHYVFGIQGIAKLFGCSETTAQRIKSSGEIDDAISQTGDIIVVDADYALDLLRISKKYRKSPSVKSKR